jgi:prolipoprotein diacylglyceryltransferase
MQFPFAFSLGSIEIPSHLVFDVLAYFAGLAALYRMRLKVVDQVSSLNRQIVLVSAVAGSLFGACFLGMFEDIPGLLTAPSWQYYFQNKSIVGGLIGGLVAVELVKVGIGERHRTGDLFVFPLLLGMIIGRFGCFLTGVVDRTVGIPSTLPWALDQGDGVLRHPTSLYEILFLIVLTVLLLLLQQQEAEVEEGGVFKLFMVGYLLFRLFIEFIKPVQSLVMGLSAIQLACLFTLGYYFIWHGRALARMLRIGGGMKADGAVSSTSRH